MTSTDATTSLSMGADSAADAERRRGLRRMRSLALSLLVLAAVVYVLTLDGEGALAYVNAAAEAAMVGAVADWFAVTALFRHPLGLPIPHTAIIPKRKESLGASLQEFVAENFLREDVVRERITSAAPSQRVGAWLGEGRHAQRVVAEGSRVMSHGLARIKADDVSAMVEEALIPRMREEQLAPVAGQLLGEIVKEDAHAGMVDLVLAELHRWLLANEDEVAEIVVQRSPWWTPSWVDERVSVRIHEEAVSFVKEIHDDRHHRARQALDRWLTELAHDLQHDPDTQRRAERLKERFLLQPQVVTTSVALWDALRRAMLSSLEDPDGLLRRRALQEVSALGRRLQEDEVLAARVDAMVADAAAYVVENYGSEVATIISSTVNRWDGRETADRIELHVGRDLQFIRINGTVVGGLAGLLIHALSVALH